MIRVWYSVGWIDFEKIRHFLCYANCYRNPIPKCHVLMLLFTLVAGHMYTVQYKDGFCKFSKKFKKIKFPVIF